MKILYAINGLGTGGAERSLNDLLVHLPEQGISAELAVLHRRPTGVQREIIARGTPVHFAPDPSLHRAIPWLRRLLREVRPDLLHTTLFEMDVAGRVASLRHGPQVLTSLVNTSYEPDRLRADPNVRAWKLQIARGVDAYTAKHWTTHFHAITTTVADAAVHRLGIPPERITVIERGRDPSLFRPISAELKAASRRQLGLPGDADIVLSVGRQEFQKGQVHLVDAFPRIRASKPQAILVIVGREGHALPLLRQAVARHGLGNHVRFLGHLPDVRPALAAADVFAFPSLYEGLGGALIEAMGCALPVVASDLPVLREVLESQAHAAFVQPENHALLANWIVRLLSDRALATAFGAGVREVFERRFTVDRSTRRMISLYKQLIV